MTDFKVPEKAIEIRCPGKFRKLFLVLRQEHMPIDGTMMEIACADCAKQAKANGAPNTSRALHYYNSAGTCVGTILVPVPGKQVPLWSVIE